MRILFVIVFLFLVSCNEKAVPKPENLVSEETMENIMFDLVVLQTIEGYLPEKLSENNIKSTTYIYKKYNLDSLSYMQNHKYYASDVKNYNKMYNRIKERLTKYQEKEPIDSIKIPEKRKGKKPMAMD